MRYARYITPILIIGFVVLWGLYLLITPPEVLVAKLGVQNSTLIAFFGALIAGSSVFTTFSFFTTLGALALGGADPLFLTFAAALGIALGDSIFFFLGKKISGTLSDSHSDRIDKFSSWLERRHKSIVPMIVYVYTAFLPLPNDLLMVALAISRIRYRRIVASIILGDATFIGLIVYGTLYGSSLLGGG